MSQSHCFRIFLNSVFAIPVCVIVPILLWPFNPLSADIKEAVCASPKLQACKEHWMVDCSNATEKISIFLCIDSLFYSLVKYSLFNLWNGSVTPESKFSGSIEQDLVCRTTPLPPHANLLLWQPSFSHSLDGSWNSFD